jgi:hypothetical protein
MIDFESEVAARFRPLADRRDDQSWRDVVARARAARRHRRRVPIAIAAVLASAVVIASPATGVRGKIVRLFGTGGPPPQQIVKSFAQWNGPQFRARVQGGRAIKVLDARVAPHTTWTLWVAPTKDGGFCTSAGSCYAAGFRYDRIGVDVGLFGRVAPDGEILSGPVVLSGETTNKRADSLVISFEDGDRESIPLVWVAKPVDAAFFIYGVPGRHWQAGHLPTTLTMLSGAGDELDTREIHGITTKGSLTP